MNDKETVEVVNTFYEIYSEFYKKCGDRNIAIQLTCAMCGLKVPKSETVSFLFNDNRV